MFCCLTNPGTWGPYPRGRQGEAAIFWDLHCDDFWSPQVSNYWQGGAFGVSPVYLHVICWATNEIRRWMNTSEHVFIQLHSKDLQSQLQPLYTTALAPTIYQAYGRSSGSRVAAGSTTSHWRLLALLKIPLQMEVVVARPIVVANYVSHFQTFGKAECRCWWGTILAAKLSSKNSCPCGWSWRGFVHSQDVKIGRKTDFHEYCFDDSLQLWTPGIKILSVPQIPRMQFALETRAKK